MIEFSRSPVNADLGVFVVRNEQTGLWDAACGNDLCGYGLHGVSDDNTSKTAAERAATAHRAHIRSLVAEREARHVKLGSIDVVAVRRADLEQALRDLDLAYEQDVEAGVGRPEYGTAYRNRLRAALRGTAVSEQAGDDRD